MRAVRAAGAGLAALGAVMTGGSASAQEALPSQPAAQKAMGEVSPGRLREAVDALAAFGTRHSLSAWDDGTRGIGAARDWLRGAFERAVSESGRSGAQAVKIYGDAADVRADGRRVQQDLRIWNVICEIPGSMPEARDRYYYAVAHYDSRAGDPDDAESDAPGANDDASGVAALLELARVLSEERLDATVLLLATAGEEQGLLGAKAHAERVATPLKRAPRNIGAVLNNDIIGDPRGADGRVDRSRVRVFSEGVPRRQDVRGMAELMRLGAENDSPSRQLARYIAFVAEREGTAVQPWLIYRSDRFLRGGDHTAFNERGYPAVRLTQVHEVYERQHQDVRTENGVRFGDAPEWVDEEYLADVTRLNAAVLVHLANAPRVPERARIIVAGLSNDTTLRWEPSPEPDVAGYEVVWRDTSSPRWQHVRDVGDATEATIELSKDNWFFGVRAYDRDGYRSPVAFPAAASE